MGINRPKLEGADLIGAAIFQLGIKVSLQAVFQVHSQIIRIVLCTLLLVR